MRLWAWIVANADWLSARCRLLSALVLSLPLVAELPKRRRHDVALKITQKPQLAPRPSLEDDSADVDTIEAEMTSDRMGGYFAAFRTVACGLALLFLSFSLSLVYALNK